MKKNFNPHERLDRRAATFCRLIAREIERELRRGESGILQNALKRIAEAKLKGVESPLLDAWREIISGGDWTRIRHFLVADGERERQLRQETPFVGVLPDEIITKVHRRHAPKLERSGL